MSGSKFVRCLAVLAAAGAVVLGSGQALAQGTYTSTAAPTVIPDDGDSTSAFGTMTVAVPDAFTVNSIAVTVGITHSYIGDVLRVQLIAPNGTIINLVSGSGFGFSDDNWKNTTFDERAGAVFPGAASPPYRSRFRALASAPAGTITLGAANIAGLSSMGTWTLRATDGAGGDVGTIDSVVLSLNERVFVGQDGTATNQATPGDSTYSSQTGLTVDIPDNTGTPGSSSLTVGAGDAQTITGVDVSFSVTHADLAQLRVRLVHMPSATGVDVIVPGYLTGSAAGPTTDGPSPNRPNLPYATTLSAGGAAIGTGTAPYRGKFAPAGAPAAFNGMLSTGAWRLDVSDEVTGTAGTIREWSLHVRGPSAVPQGVGSSVPANPQPGQTASLRVVVTPATALGNVTSVTVDVSSITGVTPPDLQPLTREVAPNDDRWSASFLVSAGTALGAKTIPFTIVETGAAADGTGSIALQVLPAPPGNDECSAALPIVVPYVSGPIGIGGALTDTNVNPTCDSSANSAGAANGIWFSITPATTGAYQFLETTPRDVVLSIWTGTCPGPLTQVVCDDTAVESSSGPGGFVRVLEGGTPYLVCVSRFLGSSGAFTDTFDLTVNLLAPPSNDTCAIATLVTAPTNLVSQAVDARGALPDLGLSCNAGSTASTVNGVWYRIDIPAGGNDFNVTIGETAITDAVLGVFAGPCASPTLRACFTADTGNVFPMPAGSTHYVLIGRQGTTTQATANPTFTVGISFSAITSACCNTGNGTCIVKTRVQCAAETPSPGFYRGPLSVACSAATTAADACQAAPANDLCSGAIAITGALPQAFTTTSPAAASDDVDASCNSTAAPATNTRFGVWYSYTTGADAGVLNISQTNAGLDTVRQVFTGSCGSLTPVLCLDPETNQNIPMLAGTTYFILLGMWGNSTTPASAYTLAANSFTPTTGACCAVSNCTVTTMSACAGLWLGAGTACELLPTYPDIPVSPVLIPDASGVVPGLLSRTILVGDATVVANIKVYLDWNVTFGGDYRIRLTGPNAQVVDLLYRPGTTGLCPYDAGGTLNSVNGRFVISDSAPTGFNGALIAGPSPITGGTFRPTTCGGGDSSPNLSAFNGIPVTGNWTLTITDEDPIGSGTLRGWGLIVNDVQVPVTCAIVGACCNGPACSLVNGTANCTGTFQGNGSSCSPNPCVPSTGACCSGSTCLVTTIGACTGANTTFAGTGTVCNAPGNATTPCCLADFNHVGGITVGDIFAFLSAWFASDPAADINGGGIAVGDIFAFLTAWFAGGCP